MRSYGEIFDTLFLPIRAEQVSLNTSIWLTTVENTSLRIVIFNLY